MGELSYHIDICYIRPRDSFGDRAQAELGAPHCLHPEAPQNTVARFRDPATVQALLAAPNWVRGAFVDAGFGLTPSGKTTPAETFDEKEDMHRMQKTQQLVAALKGRDAVAARFHSGLDMKALFAYEGRMQVIAAGKQWAQMPMEAASPIAAQAGGAQSQILTLGALLMLIALPFLSGALAAHFDGALDVSNVRIVNLSLDD
ncbi:MAG: hypothetical protein AAFY65_09470 [Pseudomonadota bacterium]